MDAGRSVRADKNGIFRGKFKTDYGRDKKGAARAVFAKQKSASFAMSRCRTSITRRSAIGVAWGTGYPSARDRRAAERTPATQTSAS